MRFVECPETHIKTNWVSGNETSIEEQKSYAAARVRDLLLEAIGAAMERAKLKRADLAKRLGTTRSAITRLLDSENPTVKTIGEALWACDVELSDVDLREFGAAFLHCEGEPHVPAFLRVDAPYQISWRDLVEVDSPRSAPKLVLDRVQSAA